MGIVEPLTGARNLNVESNFEYGSRVGFWEIMRILREHGVAATIHAGGNGTGAQPRSGLRASAERLRGGLSRPALDRLSVVPEQTERADMRRNVETITRMIGRRPLGWYTSRPGRNTRRLVAECGFLYDSDAYNDDLPYWTRVAGRAHLIIPHTFDINDSRLQRGGDFGMGEEFFAYARDAFDWLYRLGTEGRSRMMTLSLHGRIIGGPGRLGALLRLLEHVQRHDVVWLCSRAAIAQHWIAHHAAP